MVHICIQFSLPAIIIKDNGAHRQIAISNFCPQFTILQSGFFRAVNLMDTIYSKSTLFNFLSSSAMICLAGFNVTVSNLRCIYCFSEFMSH